MSDEALDAANRAEIEAEIKSAPYVGDVEDISVLDEEYANAAEVVKSKLADLGTKYAHLRRLRRDGNCFYRAMAFKVFEWLCTDASEADVTRIATIIHDSKDQLIALGYPAFGVEDFYDIVADEIAAVQAGTLTPEVVLEHFREQFFTEYCVTYFRFLASLCLKTHADEYAPFVPTGVSIDQFCKEEVDAVRSDADHLQMTALTRILGLGVDVSYLDQSETPDGTINTIVFDNNGESPIVAHLIYRPGHFDVAF